MGFRWRSKLGCLGEDKINGEAGRVSGERYFGGFVR